MHGHIKWEQIQSGYICDVDIYIKQIYIQKEDIWGKNIQRGDIYKEKTYMEKKYIQREDIYGIRII